MALAGQQRCGSILVIMKFKFLIFGILGIGLLAIIKIVFFPSAQVGRSKNFVSGELLVVMRERVSTKDTFDLFNKYNLGIETFDGIYKSALGADQIDYIINTINSKPYINPNWKLTRGAVFLHYQTKNLNVSVHFENLDRKNQTDWLSTINRLQLTEDNFSMSLKLNVPVRQEGKYIKILNKEPIIKAAEVNCTDCIQLLD